MDRVRGCTDRDESAVRALKELGSGTDLWGNEWEEWDGLVLFEGEFMFPWIPNCDMTLWKPTMTPR